MNDIIRFLSSKIYGVRGDRMYEIIAQELIQNSIDAVVSNLNSGGTGEGRIEVMLDTQSLTVRDNGSGMSPEELKTGFGVYAESHKGLESIGHYGIGAKGSYASAQTILPLVPQDRRCHLPCRTLRSCCPSPWEWWVPFAPETHKKSSGQRSCWKDGKNSRPHIVALGSLDTCLHRT